MWDFVCQWVPCTVHGRGPTTSLTSKIFTGICLSVGPVHCSQDSQTSFFNKIFIKNGSHGTIYTFKNYFVIVFSVFNKISSIQKYHNRKNHTQKTRNCSQSDKTTEKHSGVQPSSSNSLWKSCDTMKLTRPPIHIIHLVSKLLVFDIFLQLLFKPSSSK